MVPSDLVWIALLSALAAFTAVIVGWCRARKLGEKVKLCDLLEEVEWKADSLASNFTVLGTVLGSLVAITAYSEPAFKDPRAEFATAHFALLCIGFAGQSLYIATRTRSEGTKDIVYHGRVWSFLASTSIIGFAACAQAITFWFVGAAILKAYGGSPAMPWMVCTLQAAAIGVFAAFPFYIAGKTTTIIVNSRLPSAPTTRRTSEDSAPKKDSESDTSTPARKTWSLP